MARADKAAQLRADISALLFALDSLDKRIAAQKAVQAAHVKRLSLYEITYAYGDGSTETMLSLWQTADAIKNALELLLADKEETRRKLIEIIAPRNMAKIKEKAHAAVIEQVMSAWKLSGTTEELNLIVLDADDKKRVFKSEILKIFPEGTEHLPDELQPREIYPTTRNRSAKVQYIGKATRFGFNFVLFRLLK